MPWMTGAAILGGALITSDSNQDAAALAANAVPQPMAEIQPLMQQTADTLQGANPLEIYQGDRVADFSGMQTQGLTEAQRLAQAQMGQASTAAAGFDQFASGSMIGNNPYLEQAIGGMQESANRNLMQGQMPGITNNAVIGGGLGGSRQGIAQGVAMSNLNADLINKEGNMRQGQFNQDTSNMLAALTNQGSILGGQSNAMNTLLGAGGIEQAQSQANINADIGKFNEEQNSQYNRDQELLRILMGAPAGAAQIPNQTNPLLGGIGLATSLNELGVFGGGGGGQPAPQPQAAPIQSINFKPQ